MSPDGTLRLALAQINPTLGDLDGNVELCRRAIESAAEAGADLVVLPELAICGYPPEDLLLRRDFLDACGEALHELAAGVAGIVAVCGFPDPVAEPVAADPLIDPLAPLAHNAVAVLRDGAVGEVYRKQHLPNYGVFDERRYFAEGSEPVVIDVGGVTVGLTICEDIWVPGAPETEEVAAGAKLVVNSSASPYHRGKGAAREAMIARRATEAGVPIALCNMVGGQDELVFDGQSVICEPGGATLARAAQFEEGLLVCDLPAGSGGEGGSPTVAPVLGPEDEVYAALVSGLRDYTAKNGFGRVVFGLSGGIDSALVALLAADALGPEAVTAVSMPSPYSSGGTKDDAREIAANLGIEFLELPIHGAMEAYGEILEQPFAGTEQGVAEENLQARIRGNVVMALSNKFGWLVLTTGNKSEMSVGYATLYGDMAGGFAVIKDVLKATVYALVEHRNAQAGSPLVPASVLERAPSAELRPDQTDQDSLPPYDVLDAIVEGYVEDDLGPADLVSAGFDSAVVARVIGMIDRSEYKRRQAPPGIRISTKAFGRDRRLPITNRYR